MELTKTAKMQIYVSDNDKPLLLESMRVYADACNYVSHYVFETKDLSQSSVRKHVYHALRSDYGLPSQMACNVPRTVIASYKALLSNHGEWTECRYTAPQMTLSWNRDYSLMQDVFSVGTLHGRIKARYAMNGMEKYFDKSVYRFGAAKVVYKHDKFFLHVSVICNVPDTEVINTRNIVGIDRGLRFLATAYDSNGDTRFFNGKQAMQKRAHYKTVRRSLQQVRTPSSRRRLKAIGQRENRWMRDVNHCISKALVDNNPAGTLFVLEDLTGIRTASERVRVKDRYVHVSWAYYDLEQKLTYKAEEHGQTVIKADPSYTSQTCPKCGHVERGNRNRKMHVFCCRSCGYESNDDRTAAMNLHRMGIEYLVELQTGTADL